MHEQGAMVPLGDGALGWAFACSRAGSSHLRAGNPCQDAYALWSGAAAGQPCLIAAVADGHGDERHDQSHWGAALAVRAAIEELLNLHTHYGITGVASQLINGFKNDFPRRLGRRWREAVMADARSRLGQGSEETREDPGLLVRYGTTLIGALVVREMVLVTQIGDGTALWLGLPADVDCLLADAHEVGVVTDSLCSAGADRLWRTAVRDGAEGGLLLLSTDGLVNAFVDDAQFFAFARSFRDRLGEFGMLPVASSLPGWLDHYSNQGSGDDITLAALMIQPGSPRPENATEGGASTESKVISQEPVDVTGDRTTSFCGDGQERLGGGEKIG